MVQKTLKERRKERVRGYFVALSASHCYFIDCASKLVLLFRSSLSLSLLVPLIPHLFLQFSREEKENNEMGRATKVKRGRKKKGKRGNARNLRLYISAFLSASFFLSLKLYFFFVTVVLPVNRNFSPSAIRFSSLGRVFPSPLVSSAKRSTRGLPSFPTASHPLATLPRSTLFRPFRSFSSLPWRPRG